MIVLGMHVGQTRSEPQNKKKTGVTEHVRARLLIRVSLSRHVQTLLGSLCMQALDEQRDAATQPIQPFNRRQRMEGTGPLGKSAPLSASLVLPGGHANGSGGAHAEHMHPRYHCLANLHT